MSGALGALAKLGFFVLVVVVGVFLFRQDSRRALADRWAMHKCPEFVQADVGVVLPWSEPKVGACEGTPSRATCMIETTEKGGRKQAPVREWDCTKRHISPDFYRDFTKAAMQRPQPGVSVETSRREMLERTLKVKEDLVEAFKYVVDKLRERYESLGEPGPFPGPFGARGFPGRPE